MTAADKMFYEPPGSVLSAMQVAELEAVDALMELSARLEAINARLATSRDPGWP